MFKLLLFATTVLCVLTPQQQFHSFILKHGKQYASFAEREARFSIFKENLKNIERLNAQNTGVTYGITPFTDMTSEEFIRRMTKLPRPARELVFTNTTRVKGLTLPAEFDWRTKGGVTPVKNQGDCGSCWAFSCAQNAEGIWAVAGKGLMKFSPQQVMDCTPDCGGCSGGFAVKGSAQIVKTGGLMREEDYPYEEVQRNCRFDPNLAAAKFSSTVDITMTDVAVKEYLYEHGPLSMGVRAGYYWQSYKSGITKPDGCISFLYNHDVLVVGWGTSTTGDYWIIKNSWGEDWGESGYIRVYMQDNCWANDVHSIVV